MSSIKLMFFINGSEGSAAGVRAQLFAERLPQDWSIRFHYRPSPKWKGIVPFIQAAIAFKPDVIYVMDTAYTGVLAGYVVKKLLGCKVVTDTGDVAFELAKSSGTYSKPQLALINGVEQLATHHSDHLVVRGRYHQEWFAHQGIDQVTFVPDGVVTKEINLPDRTLMKQRFGLTDSMIVGLIGTMSWSDQHQMCYGWDVVEALALLKDIPIKALLVGDGDGRSILEQRAEELGVRDRMVFVGQVPYDTLPDYLAAIDICISTQSNDLVGQVRTTGKLPLYLAHQKYVIATDVGEARQILPGIGCLLPYEGVRDNHHPARLAAQLRKLVSDPSLLDIAQSAGQVAAEHFDYDVLAKRIENLCLQLVKRTDL
jgi:glycosyltransferase involved in cell wall biosynthesis